MAYTLNNSITYSKSFAGGLDPTVWTGSEPAITAANTVVSLILNPPFTWPWNRVTVTQAITSGGGQDYTVSQANFGFLEKVSVAGGSPSKNFELENVYNTQALALTSQIGRPNSVAVQTYIPGTSFSPRFTPVPDVNYTASLIYQKAPTFFTATSQDWFTQAGIPYFMIDVFNPLFISEMLQNSDDPSRAQVYRTRGMAALLSKQDGLNAMQKNAILGQYMADNSQSLAAQLATQQGVQAKGV